MDTPIKKEGLQIEAALNMGNSLYSILLATMLGATALLLQTDELISLLTAFKTIDFYVRMISAVTVILLVVYYIVDWHDLNQVAYFDEVIGKAQMTLWMLCICIVSLSSVLSILIIRLSSPVSMLNQATVVAVLTAIYIPTTFVYRNKLIKEPELPKKTTPKEAFEQGREHEKLTMAEKNKRTRSLVCAIVASLLWIFGTVCVYRLNTEWRCLLIYAITCLGWLVALFLKFRRSEKYVSVQYREFISLISKETVVN